MTSSRSIVRIAVVHAAGLEEHAARWASRLTTELAGATATATPAARLRTADGRPVRTDAEVVVVLAGGEPRLASEAVDAAIHASEGDSGDPTARLVVVSDAWAPRAGRTGIDRIAEPGAEASLVPFLRGMISAASGLREARRELSLLNRVVASMRSELEERSDELQLAALVQRDFLPLPVPPLHGVRVTSFYRPLAQVSGDVYHVEQVDGDRLAIFLADAVGHGIPAALLGMAVCRSLETTDLSHGRIEVLGPGETLARANRRLVAQQRMTTRFATAIAGVLDCRTRRLRLAVAGHPPAVLLRPGEPARPIEADGGLLGIFADERYEEIELALEPNDRLLFYSDGFEQAFTANGEPRHVEAFGELSGVLDGVKLVEEIAARVDEEHGSLHQADDLTLLCISVETPAAQSRAAA
ncbi:MAG: Phosphoserine phosphatase RsbP [Planctomycetota bacterium]